MSGDREAARHITRTWFEWEIDGLARKVILVVETDLAMQPDEQDYDALTLDMLRTEAIARSRNVAAYVPAEFVNPQLELVVVLPRS